jgi:TonB family protein
MIGVMAAALAVLAPAGEMIAPASAAPKPPAAHVIVEPTWLRKPSGDDLVAGYPQAANDQHIDGRATVHCFVDSDGAPLQCKAMEETPVGFGFGDAAVALVMKQRFHPRTVDGRPEKGEFTSHIIFKMPEWGNQAGVPFEEAAVCAAYARALAEANPSLREAWHDIAFWEQNVIASGAGRRLRPHEIESAITDSVGVAQVMVAGGDMSTIGSCRDKRAETTRKVMERMRSEQTAQPTDAPPTSPSRQPAGAPR